MLRSLALRIPAGVNKPLPLHMVCWANMKDIGDELTGDEGFLDEHEDIFRIYDEEQCFWMKNPLQGRYLKKGGKSKVKERGGESKGGKGSGARRFFRPCRKGGGKGKKSGKADSSSASKANIAEKK